MAVAEAKLIRNWFPFNEICILFAIFLPSFFPSFSLSLSFRFCLCAFFFLFYYHIFSVPLFSLSSFVSLYCRFFLSACLFPPVCFHFYLCLPFTHISFVKRRNECRLHFLSKSYWAKSNTSARSWRHVSTHRTQRCLHSLAVCYTLLCIHYVWVMVVLC
jgi:hypothetical protein